MGRVAKIPDAKQREVAFDVLDGKYSRREATKILEENGYPPVSDIAIQRYVEKYRPEHEAGKLSSNTQNTPLIASVATKRTVSVNTAIISKDMIANFEHDIGRIDDAIRTHYDYIQIMKRRIEFFETQGDPSSLGKADLLRKRVTESFVALVKAEVSKIELLRDHVMMTQSTEVKSNVATDIRSAYDKGYKTGLEDAEQKFATLMEDFRKKSISVESKP